MIKSLLVSSQYFPPQTGGISHFMAALASALGPGRVCCLTGPARRAVLNHGFGPRVYRRPAGIRENPLQVVSLGATIARIMIRERPRIVQLATIGEGSLGLWLRRWFKLPFVVYAHGNEILSALREDAQGARLALRQADRVLAVSRFTANLVRQTGVASQRIEIVHPGCEVDRFRPLHPRTDLRQRLLGTRYGDRVIVTVGNLVERKGYDMVIRALPRLRKTIPEVTYLIVGDGPHRAQLQTLALAMGVQDRVSFAGQVPADDLPDIYALSDVFVMASRERLEMCDVEGFGLVFLEANACAKPVVGGRSGGIPDAVVDGVTGLLVDPHDPEDIANALSQLLTDRDLAIRLGQQGRSRVVKDFTWARVSERVQRILASIVEENSIRG